MSKTTADLSARLTQWFAAALPVWAAQGFDEEQRLFHEMLDMEGEPKAAPLRLTSHARQIYTFAHAASSGQFADGRQIAGAAYKGLRDRFRMRDEVGGYVYTVDRLGKPVSETRDAYAQAFVLFAMASLYTLEGDPEFLRTANEMQAFFDRHLADPRHGGYQEAYPVPADKPRRQNPHMHLLEAYLALAESSQDDVWLMRAGKMLALFEKHFFDGSVLTEFFDADWTPRADDHGLTVEPGHHFEWVWLLEWHKRLTGRDHAETQEKLFGFASLHGVGERGNTYDRVDPAGRVVTSTARTWTITEAMKAAAIRAAGGDRASEELLGRLGARLFGSYLEPFGPGLYADTVTESGESIVPNCPATTLYHLMTCQAELARLAK